MHYSLRHRSRRYLFQRLFSPFRFPYSGFIEVSTKTPWSILQINSICLRKSSTTASTVLAKHFLINVVMKATMRMTRDREICFLSIPFASPVFLAHVILLAYLHKCLHVRAHERYLRRIPQKECSYKAYLYVHMLERDRGP